MKEHWRAIKNCPGYQVSDLGRVRSFKRNNAGSLIKQAVKHDSRKNQPEYLRVTVVDARGAKKTFRVNRLVLIHFVGSAPTKKHAAAHIDGNSLNNTLLNLKWATQKQNEADKIKHGTKLIGNDIANAKLHPSAVRRIRRVKVWDAALKKKFMADLGVSRSAINDVLSGRTWGWVK